jgi:hypothetical protein
MPEQMKRRPCCTGLPPMCEWAEENHSQIFQFYTVIRQKRTLEDNVLQGPGFHGTAAWLRISPTMQFFCFQETS